MGWPFLNGGRNGSNGSSNGKTVGEALGEKEGDLAGWDRFLEALDKAPAPGPGKVLANLIARGVDVPLKAAHRLMKGDYASSPTSPWTDPRMAADAAEIATSMGMSSLPAAGRRAAAGMAGAAIDPELGIFIGEKAKTANLVKLQEAKAMTKAGVDRQKIWEDTGWFLGKDKKWRSEISDEALQSIEPTKGGVAGTAGEMMQHPKLFEAYPQLKEMALTLRTHPMEVMQGTTKGRMTGYYKPPPVDPLGRPIGRGSVMASGLTPDDVQSVLAHEFGHVVEDIEGFAPGLYTREEMVPFMEQFRESSLAMFDEDIRTIKDMLKGKPENADELRKTMKELVGKRKELAEVPAAKNEYDAYFKSMAEVMARATEKRRLYSDAWRKLEAPWHSMSVPEEKQLIPLHWNPPKEW